MLEKAPALRHIKPVGLMTVPPFSSDPESTRPYFRRLRELLFEVNREFGASLTELSMGMSADFAVAIEEGATMVRDRHCHIRRARMKPWEGRFTGATDALMERFSSSIAIDWRLFRYDIEGSVAYAEMLERIGILEKGETSVIVAALSEIAAEIESGSLAFRDELEDIHMHVEQRLIEKVGELGQEASHRQEQERTGLPRYADVCERRAVPAGR